jgi:hypothetical protein
LASLGFICSCTSHAGALVASNHVRTRRSATTFYPWWLGVSAATHLIQYAPSAPAKLLHTVRDVIEALLANPACVDASESLTKALREVNRIQRSRPSGAWAAPGGGRT